MNLRKETYCSAISEGNEQEWNFLWERFRSSYGYVASEKSIILNALACTKEVWLLNRYKLVFLGFSNNWFIHTKVPQYVNHYWEWITVFGEIHCDK